ncbi:MAG TPA: TolC family protein [Kofleriaceae bacterium]|nr:TolC family protein [Kofleriaceae bacterium]
MRVVRFVVFVMLGLTSSPAAADVLGHVLAAADDQTGGAPPAPPAPQGAPPEQSADLTAWAGEAHSVTLADLLQSAVRQAPALASARIDVAVAEAQIQETWARNDWKLQAQLQGSHQTVVTEGTVTTISGSADLQRLLPAGGTVALHVDSTYNNISDSPFGPAGDGTLWVDNVEASITQPLLRGRGRTLFDANEAKATLQRDVTVLARRLAAINAVQTVISAYWDLVLAERTVGITQASLDLARERLRITTIGADGGKVARSEIPAVLQIIATRQEDVLNGELVVLNNSITLRRLAGMPIGAGELGLRVATDLDTQDQAIDLGALTERAFAASPQLAELAKQDQSSTIDIAVTEDGLLPQLDAALSLGPSGTSPAQSASGAASPSGTFGGAWKDLVELNALTIQGSLKYTQSLGRNDVIGRSREQRELRRKLVVNAFDVRAQIAQAMAAAVAQLEVAKRRVALSQQAIELANQNIKIETDRFNLGRSTNFDVLNRLEDLRQAELRRAQALVDWHKAEAMIQSLTGEILPRYGVTIDDR